MPTSGIEPQILGQAANSLETAPLVHAGSLRAGKMNENNDSG